MSSSPAGLGLTLADALTALALTCGVPPGSAWLDAAVAAGLAEDERTLAPSVPPDPPTSGAGLTTWVLPAAACALVSTADAGVNAATAMDDGLRDVAAALLVVCASAATVPADEPPGEGLRSATPSQPDGSRPSCGRPGWSVPRARSTPPSRPSSEPRDRSTPASAQPRPAVG